MSQRRYAVASNAKQVGWKLAQDPSGICLLTLFFALVLASAKVSKNRAGFG